MSKKNNFPFGISYSGKWSHELKSKMKIFLGTGKQETKQNKNNVHTENKFSFSIY